MKQEIKFNRPCPTEEAMKNLHRFIAKNINKISLSIIEKGA